MLHPILSTCERLTATTLLLWCVACSGAPDPPVERAQSPALPRTASELHAVRDLDSLAPVVTTELVDTLGRQYVSALTTIRNPSKQRVRVGWTGCDFPLEVYGSAARSGFPAWESRRWKRRDPATFVGCLLVRDTVVAPGDTLGPPKFLVGAFEPVRRMLGDSLPPGRYYFGAVLHLNGDSLRVPAGSIVLHP